MESIKQFRLGRYINWSLLFAFLSLGFCVFMIYLATWSPIVNDLIDPNRTINLRFIEFIQHGQLIFLTLAIISLIFAVTMVFPKDYHLVYRVLLASIFTIVSCLVIASVFFAPTIGDDSRTFQAIELVDQEIGEGVDYNLVKIEYLDHFPAYYIVVYRCDDSQFNCRALYSYSVPFLLDMFESSQSAYSLQWNDNNELVLLEDDVEIWSTELSD